jgi:tRNA(fMet)-specific endonuclease VapC
MVVLDTDHMSLLEKATSPEGQRLNDRLEALGEEPATTIISYEEQVRGWMAVLANANSMAKQIDAYSRLLQQLRNYCSFKVLPFNDRPAAEFQKLKASRLRIGTMDLKIAAVVISQQAVLLSGICEIFNKFLAFKSKTGPKNKVPHENQYHRRRWVGGQYDRLCSSVRRGGE